MDKAGILSVLSVNLLLFSPAALAYLDPGTGSMIISAIVGIFASVALAVKTYWYRLKAVVRRMVRGEEHARGESGDTGPGQ